MADRELPAWGRQVSRVQVAGHPCLAYGQRPRAVADFLLTARRWPERELLVQGDRRLTVAEHERAVARAACHLRGLVLTGRLPAELPDAHMGTVSLVTVPLFHLAGIHLAVRHVPRSRPPRHHRRRLAAPCADRSPPGRTGNCGSGRPLSAGPGRTSRSMAW